MACSDSIDVPIVIPSGESPFIAYEELCKAAVALAEAKEMHVSPLASFAIRKLEIVVYICIKHYAII